MTLRIGVVGLGLGRTHVQAILNHPEAFTLTAVCDPNTERLEIAPPQTERFTEFDAFLERAPVDAVVLAVPHSLHEPQTVAALRAGTHVLVEKPMARTSEECRSMMRAAAEAKRTLMVAQNWRFTPELVAAKRVIESGELGPIRAVRTEWTQNIYMHGGAWLRDGEVAGGGPLMSLVVHNLDYLRYVLGEVSEVSAMVRLGDPGFIHGAESWGMAQLHFAGGIMGQVYTSYAAYAPTDGRIVSIYGDDGTIHIRKSERGRGPWIASRTRFPGTAPHEVKEYQPLDVAALTPDLLPSARENLLRHFAECCRNGTEPLTGGSDNIRTIRLVEAIYEAARSRQVVRVGGGDAS